MHPERSAFEIWNLCIVGLEGIVRQILETLVGVWMMCMIFSGPSFVSRA
jgi:hypothetical protein